VDQHLGLPQLHPAPGAHEREPRASGVQWSRVPIETQIEGHCHGRVMQRVGQWREKQPAQALTVLDGRPHMAPPVQLPSAE
jgi:hypothetical protein